MTLIAAFRSYGGAVICADSQETLTVPIPNGYADYRCRVDKIKPTPAGEYLLVIGGAGDGPLVDGFTERLTDEITSWQGNLDEATIKGKIRSALLDYYRNEVAVSGATRNPEFLVCLKHTSGGSNVFLWELRGPTVKTVDKYSLIGWEEGIYRHFVDRLYKSANSSTNRALLVGVYLMQLGKSTSNVIGGPTIAIRASNNFIVQEDAGTVAEVERRIESFATILEDLTLWCPDPDLPNHEFIGYLDNVEKELMQLRERYLGPTMKHDV